MKLLILCTFIIYQESISQSIQIDRSYTQKTNLDLIVRIYEEENEFYKNITATALSNEKYAIYDLGNKQIHIYSNKGKLIKSFGKFGNGPGELNGREVIYSSKSYIILLQYGLLKLYDYEGNYIKTIKDRIDPGSRIIPKEDGFTLILGSSPNKYHIVKDYNHLGKVLRKKTNPYYKVKEKKKKKKNFDPNRMINRKYNVPIFITLFLNNIVESYKTNYKLRKTNINTNETTFFTSEIIRNKLLENFSPSFSIRGGKNEKEINKKLYDVEYNKTGGYQDDITSILGSDNYYIYIRTSAKDNKTLNIDIIDKDFKLISTISKTFKNQVLNSTRVEQGKLLAVLKSDELGPYLEVYNMRQ